MFDPSVFFPLFKAAGMLSVATVTSGGDTFELDVGFSMPDVDRLGNDTVSRDYEIEYQHADAPDLAEGELVVISDVAYIVRFKPRITQPGNAADGYYRTAILTNVDDEVLRAEDGSVLLSEDGIPLFGELA